MQKSAVITDKKKIRETISTISWREARRLKGPIYEALVQELYEENCLVAAKHMHCLARKEQDMLQKRLIRTSLSQKPALLEALFENVKTAERASKLQDCSGLAVTFKLLYQCLLLLEEQGNAFDWLLEDVYTIITDICDGMAEDKLSDGTMRAIAHIYHQYGSFLCSRNLDMEKAVHSLEKALKLSRANNWTASGRDCEDWERCETLHGAAATKLVSMLLDYALKVVNTDVTKAMDLTQEAIVTIAEVKSAESALIRCQAHLVEARIYIEGEDYRRAMRVLEHLGVNIVGMSSWQYAQLNCELALYKGLCYSGLGDMTKARQMLRQALLLSSKYDLAAIEAKACFSLGRMHAHHQDELVTAKQYLERAKQLYSQLGQLNEQKKVLYQLAKLEAKRIFPLFMDMLKSYEERYCCFYHLRNWKNQCKPFWPEMNHQLFEKQLVEVHCLLQADSANCVNPVRSVPTLLPSAATKYSPTSKIKLVSSETNALEGLRRSSQFEENELNIKK